MRTNHATVRDIFESYISALYAKETVTSNRAARYEALCEKYIYASEIAHLPAYALTADKFLDFIRRVLAVSSPRTARDLNVVMRAAYDRSNPIPLVRPIKSRPRTRWLTKHELCCLWAVLNSTGETCTHIGIRTQRLNILLGGQRLAQLLRVPISNLDLDRATITLVDERDGRYSPNVLPLTSLAIVEAKWLVDHANTMQSHQLFAGMRKGTSLRVSTLSQATAEISSYLLTNNKVGQPFQARDIRRTIETHLAALGIPSDIRARIQFRGVPDVATTRHIDQNDYMAEKRAALQLWQDYLSSFSVLSSSQPEWLAGWGP